MKIPFRRPAYSPFRSTNTLGRQFKEGKLSLEEQLPDILAFLKRTIEKKKEKIDWYDPFIEAGDNLFGKRKGMQTAALKDKMTKVMNLGTFECHMGV